MSAFTKNKISLIIPPQAVHLTIHKPHVPTHRRREEMPCLNTYDSSPTFKIPPIPSVAQVYVPMAELVANSPRIVNPLGRTWENVLTVTRQPSTEGSRATG